MTATRRLNLDASRSLNPSQDHWIGIEIRCFAITTYDRALREAGFADIRWPSLTVPGHLVNAFAEGFWNTFLELEPIIAFECIA